MKTFSMNATWSRLTLFFLTTCFSTLSAQDTAAVRMHEVGLQISNFNLEDFGLVYKVQRLTNENRYMRYRLVFSNVGFVSQQDGDDTDFNLGLGGAIGFERRHALGERVQFLQGPEFSVGFSHSNFNQQFIEFTTTSVNAGIGYILGLQYNINEKFYINLETIPALSFSYNTSRQENGNQKSTNNTTSLNANFNSESIALTLAFRFGVMPK